MFEDYQHMLIIKGGNEREAIRKNSTNIKEALFRNSQSYKKVKVDGRFVDARITTDVRDTVKTGGGNYLIEFRESFKCYAGMYVEIENRDGQYDHWLIIDVLDDLIFPKALIKKCIYNLKWVNRDGEIISRYIAFDDSYKLYQGIRTYNNNTSLPGASVILIVPYDEETKYLRADFRLLIDSAVTDDDVPDAYKITNRNALSRLYNGHGVINLVLTQSQFNPLYDNRELMIADYYKEPKNNESDFLAEPNCGISKAEIYYTGSNKIVMDTPGKTFLLRFYNHDGEIIEDELGQWEVKILPEFTDYISYEVSGNTLKIKSIYNENLHDYLFKIIGKNEDSSIHTELNLRVVSGI